LYDRYCIIDYHALFFFSVEAPEGFSLFSVLCGLFERSPILLFFLALDFFKLKSPVLVKELEMVKFLTESLLTFLIMRLHFLDNVLLN
jgi:hypothetical protein